MEDFNNFDNYLIKMSNQLARKTPKNKVQETFGLTEQKLFYIALMYANKIEDDGTIRIQKKELFDILGVDNKNQWTAYHEYFKSMQRKTYYDNSDSEEFDAGYLIYRVKSNRNEFIIKFDNELIPHLRMANQYTTLYFGDIIKFKCKHTAPLYQRIRSNNHHQTKHSSCFFTTFELKEIFGLSKEDYVNKKTGKFKRSEFEKKTIEEAVKEINSSSLLIRNVKWTKDKPGAKVLGYIFSYENVELEEAKNMLMKKEEENPFKDASITKEELSFVINEVSKICETVNYDDFMYVFEQLSFTNKEKLLSKSTIELYQFFKEAAKSIEFGKEAKTNLRGYLFTTINNMLK